METKLTKDRNYYRMMNNDELINHVKGMTHLTELERVLFERLKKHYVYEPQRYD
jgi:hypothetical protein